MAKCNRQSQQPPRQPLEDTQAAHERRLAQERARQAREQQKLINSALRGVLGTFLGRRR